MSQGRVSSSDGGLSDAATDLRQARVLESRSAFDAAAALCEQILQRDAHNFDTWFLLSSIEHRRGKPQAALDAIERAVACAPENADGYCRRGSILRSLERTEEAAESQRRAIAIDPAHAEAHNNLGNCLRDLKQLPDALEHYQRAVALKPDYTQAHNNLGVVQRGLGQEAAAIASFQRAIALRPGYANAHLNLGLALLTLERPTEAEAALRRAIALAPKDGASHCHLAHFLMQHGRIEEGKACLLRAAALKPRDVEEGFDLGLLLLSHGLFKAGWEHYETRWLVKAKKDDRTAKPIKPKLPVWQGEPLEGKAILIQSEQGLGDIIQVCRYIPLLAARGAKVTLFVPAALVRLLAPITAVADVTSRVNRSRRYDYRCFLMSLPRAFGTELDTIPRTEGPYLFAEPERVAAWRERIGAEGFKIGICWQGNPKALVDAGRSIPLAAFAPLARLPGVRLISLQKNHGVEQLDSLPPGMTVETLGPDFDSGPDAFLDSAAVIRNCDMVITSDTSMAHLAGALDWPTWVGLSTTADWRWFRDRSDCPWYRSLTLFRQRSQGDWEGVFAAMAERLGGELAAKAEV